MGAPFASVLVTGGAGFIGSNFVHGWLRGEGEALVNLDRLTYAGNLENLAPVMDNPHHVFVRGSINDGGLLSELFRKHRPRAVVHFAAESHVDRSIFGPEEFVHTNINGTFQLLQSARGYWDTLDAEGKSRFRFLHVSTDEVYGSLDADDPPFRETTPYDPHSPYSASKAASDHLVRAFHHTYGLPTLITNCSNNYGPYQFPEKLIPLMVLNALAGKPLPVYGDGMNIRDWLYVEDHCEAIRCVLATGRPGETYNIGGCSEKTNLEVVQTICDVLQELRPANANGYRSLVTFVKDRPGHDRRYAIDCRKLEGELGWRRRENFASGMRKTVQWYLDHPQWVENVTSGEYQKWVHLNYASRGD